ncbi:MAG: 5'/3'-nucleotidase SurE [Acidobacteria bacterium]|nr:5'/3'-nucleotidase SurE [Acidobacteriota bacterium]
MALRARKKILVCLLFVGLLVSPAAVEKADGNGELFILLTNDDGYDAAGLRALAEALAPLGEVMVAAPETNQSGTGHSTTTHEFIEVRPVELVPGVKAYAIAARPATCVRMALEALAPRRPDLVVSGINRGRNLGVVTYYSGTVGAAREASFVGIPALAVSNQRDDAKEYAATAAFVRELIEELRASGRLRPGLFLNINAPAGEWRGVRITRQSTTATPQLFSRFASPRGGVYYWSDYAHLGQDEEGTDVWAFLNGFISITPMELDQTASGELDWLRQWEREAAPAR